MDATDTDDAKLSPDEEATQDEGRPFSIKESRDLASRWKVELAASKKWMNKFTVAAVECERQYIDTSDASLTRTSTDYAGKTNIFWSNVQVILSAIYGRLPKAEVKRKFDDFDDDVARVAGEIMQRILNGDLERDWDDTAAAMRDAVADRFIAGLGQVWCRYDVDIDTQDVPLPPDPMTGQPPLDPATGQPQTQPQETITNEEAEVDYVHWSDFRYSPCRRWRECRWVARRVYMTKKRLKDRFKLSDEQAAMVPMVSKLPADAGSTREEDVLKATPFQQAAIWEIWSKDDNYVCWLAEGCDFLLDRQPDPLELDEFFPCPQPVVATTLTRAFLPRPDYAMAQDLYRELDRINAKLSHLTDACKAAGVYDKNAASVKTLFNADMDNSLIPVENWSAFVEKGGLKGVVDWMPIEAFVNAVQQLSTRKQQIQHDLYEVLGISDIMRGASLASETATAQQLKVQYGGARLANLQNDVARFVSEVMRIRANIIANIFQPETIVKRSLIDRTPDAALAQPAIQMLKDFGTSLYSITVTADTLAAPDWASEKEARTEFLGAASNYIMAAGPVVSQSPMVGSFLIKLLQWAAAGFKGATSIEGVLDEAAKQMADQAAAPPPPPPPPTPEEQKHLAQADKAKADAGKAQADTGKSQADAARTAAETHRIQKESNLIPPLNIQPEGPMMGVNGLPTGSVPGAFGMPAAIGAAPGTVPPMLPPQALPPNPMSPQ
jgi:hypothetical protein